MAYGTIAADSLLNSPAGLNINGGYVTANVNSLGTGLVPAEQFYRLNSDLAGANATGAQSVLGVGVTLVGSTVYQFEGVYALSKTAGTTNHTIGYGFGGTATLNNIAYIRNYTWTTNSFAPIQTVTDFVPYGYIQTAASTTFVNENSTTASIQWIVHLKGTVSVNAGGTFIPQYTLSAAPGGAYTTAQGSYFKISPLGASGSNTSIGTWA